MLTASDFNRKEAFASHLKSLNEKQKNLELIVMNVSKSLAAMDVGNEIANADKFTGLTDLKDIEDESERVAKYYEIIDEGTRLNETRAARIEFITNTMIINRYLTEGAKIADIGAGTGEYSLHYANIGYEVTAVDLSPANLQEFSEKINPEYKIELIESDARNLPLGDNIFDVVLVFGPLYHLEKQEDRSRCINEAKRICKKDGILLFTFINHDMIPFTETFRHNPMHFLADYHDNKNHRIENFPFVFLTVNEAKEMILNEGIELLTAAASEGLGELMANQINDMPEEIYQKYLNYHLHVCEKPEMLGTSNHLIVAGRNLK